MTLTTMMTGNVTQAAVDFGSLIRGATTGGKMPQRTKNQAHTTAPLNQNRWRLL
jgi:uncharacterized membrane protein YoaK (UPF0700 family)